MKWLQICEFPIEIIFILFLNTTLFYNFILPVNKYLVHSLSRVVVPATLHDISVNAHFTRFLSNLETVNKNVLKIILIIVNINKYENKSPISNQFSLKNDFSPTSWRTILRR